MNIDMINAAAERLKGHARHTPLLNSPFLDEIAGRRVWVKAEPLQHTGSFKFRGGWSAVSALPDDVRARGVIAFSSGNHAQGVALAAKSHGVPAVIVMPEDAPQLKIDNTRALGGEVILYDRENEDRDAIGQSIAADRGLTLIRPFDEPQVIAGQGTVGLEITQDAAALGITKADVLVCCGGGGLTSGIALALEANAPEMTVRPVEPIGFDDVIRSLASGQIESNPTQSGSICDAIVTKSPGDLTFPIMQRLCGAGITVPDQDCLRAMAQAFVRLKLVTEPGGAIALAAALYHHNSDDTDVIAVASGGNVDTNMFSRALSDHKDTK
ncbi:threonine/serine dehydratase [Thalassobium sp. R2A62]|jgi:threonine dehydratase|uniref:threonine ammonia-lyase n=1 Tax=Thalassobium sp. R2A62 TaxID=633131 RepID=UPI0001B1D450|nr:threonine/serine dehydratase [Thalassobium sp. R2A62]EET49061.1 threo-3-hydroxyaspartate ammonia-lyase [Thalassobium sp. R2A62]MDG1339655.1 threonine/serine dehydratase [Paracoccaceae bacterium]MDG2452535.1 threonine/serine dehydratase [Paracoccaceae bacterium]